MTRARTAALTAALLATACGPIELVVPEDAGAGTDGAAALDGAAPLDAGSDAGPLPEPDPRQPCETASCWDTSAASLRCGAWSIGEDFSSGRYNVHRYRARAFAESVTRFELRMTAGSELPAIVVATTDGRILSDGAIGAPGTDPMIDVEDDGRGGGPARVAVTAAIDMELDVYVTSWSVIDSGYGAPKPTEVRYELRVADDCGPLPPGFGLAPPGAMEGELDAELAGDIVLTDAWSAPYRVDARPAEHVTFRLDFTPTSADVRWELYRYDGREPVRLAQNGAPDLMEWEGFRAVAALDQAGSRTYWIRFRRADGGSADAVLAIERVPFTDAAVCADDCARLMVLPQPNDASDGYGVPGHTIYTWQYGRRDLLMAIRHGGRRMASIGAARFTVKDLSRWDGEVWSAHSTHDDGLHADISLIDASGTPVWRALCTASSSSTCVAGTVSDFGARHMARMIDAFFDSERVIWVLLDREYHAPLLEAVDALIAEGEIAPERRELFDATTPECAGRPCVRHVVSHHHHVHIAVAR